MHESCGVPGPHDGICALPIHGLGVVHLEAQERTEPSGHWIVGTKLVRFDDGRGGAASFP